MPSFDLDGTVDKCVDVGEEPIGRDFSSVIELAAVVPVVEPVAKPPPPPPQGDSNFPPSGPVSPTPAGPMVFHLFGREHL